MIANHKRVRRINRSNILKAILTRGPISRVKLSENTGLKESTVSRIISELIKENLVYESSLDESLIGRKPINLRINEKYGIYGIIDITHIRTAIAVCDLGGWVCDSKETDTVRVSAESFFTGCAETLARMIRSFKGPLVGVAVIAPGFINSRAGYIYTDKVLDWGNVDVKGIVQQHIESKVFLEDCSRAGALAEIYFAPEARDLSDFVFINVSYTGIGTGIVISGRVYYGAYCMVGVFGKNVIKVDGRWEDFSLKDSWETNASDQGTVRRYCELTGTPVERDIDYQIERVINLAKDGDYQAVQALKETARELGVGIANINWGLGPERIIVGGKIVQVWEMVFPELIKQVDRLTPYQVTPVRDLVIPSSLDRYTFDGGRALVLQDLLFSGFDSDLAQP